MSQFKRSIQFSKPTSHIFLKSIKHFSSQKPHLDDVGPVASHLKTRAVVRFRGPDTVKFLQGLLTHDVRRFAEPVGEKTSTVPTPNLSSVSIPPMYAAMLTPRGRLLYDFFIYRPSLPVEKLDKSGSGPGPNPEELELLADVDGSILDELLDILKN